MFRTIWTSTSELVLSLPNPTKYPSQNAKRQASRTSGNVFVRVCFIVITCYHPLNKIFVSKQKETNRRRAMERKRKFTGSKQQTAV